jgi:hypothetical protein
MAIEQIVEVGGQRWRVRAKSMKAALNEIAMATCMGSVGSTSHLDETLCGGTVTLIAEVHRIDADGNDVRPS